MELAYLVSKTMMPKNGTSIYGVTTMMPTNETIIHGVTTKMTTNATSILSQPQCPQMGLVYMVSQP